MHHRSLAFSLLLAAAPMLGGCVAAVVGGAAVGAGAAHDRRDAGTYFDDKRIYLAAYDAMNKDKELALRNSVVIVVYNGVMLLVGEVRTPELRSRAERLVTGFEGTRRIVNEIEVREPEGWWSRRADNALTARVKTGFLDLTSLPGFDPTRVNVTTAHRVVYLMGKVSHEEDDAVTQIARDTDGVEKVVKVFEYSD
ncbi:MAG TPA: BON domain-containing protein [Rhodanobacteraceae bacterium]|nr:BON domain-containing protein [Rhodanobacteraceae bacterium]